MIGRLSERDDRLHRSSTLILTREEELQVWNWYGRHFDEIDAQPPHGAWITWFNEDTKERKCLAKAKGQSRMVESLATLKALMEETFFARDCSGHWYKLPERMRDQWIEDTQDDHDDDDYAFESYFEDAYSQYRTGGGPE